MQNAPDPNQGRGGYPPSAAALATAATWGARVREGHDLNKEEEELQMKWTQLQQRKQRLNSELHKGYDDLKRNPDMLSVMVNHPDFVQMSRQLSMSGNRALPGPSYSSPGDSMQRYHVTESSYNTPMYGAQYPMQAQPQTGHHAHWYANPYGYQGQASRGYMSNQQPQSVPHSLAYVQPQATVTPPGHPVQQAHLDQWPEDDARRHSFRGQQGTSRVNATHAQSSSSAATPIATIAPVSATKSTSANVPAQVSGSESRASNVAHPSSHESRSTYEQATHTSKPSLETPVVNLPEPQSTLLTHTHGFSSPTPAGEQIIFAPPGPSNLQPTLNRDGTSQSLEHLAKTLNHDAMRRLQVQARANRADTVSGNEHFLLGNGASSSPNVTLPVVASASAVSHSIKSTTAHPTGPSNHLTIMQSDSHGGDSSLRPPPVPAIQVAASLSRPRQAQSAPFTPYIPKVPAETSLATGSPSDLPLYVGSAQAHPQAFERPLGAAGLSQVLSSVAQANVAANPVVSVESFVSSRPLAPSAFRPSATGLQRVQPTLEAARPSPTHLRTRTPADANIKTLAFDILRSLGPPKAPLRTNSAFVMPAPKRPAEEQLSSGFEPKKRARIQMQPSNGIMAPPPVPSSSRAPSCDLSATAHKPPSLGPLVLNNGVSSTISTAMQSASMNLSDDDDDVQVVAGPSSITIDHSMAAGRRATGNKQRITESSTIPFNSPSLKIASYPPVKTSRPRLPNRAYVLIPPAPLWVEDYKRWKNSRTRSDGREEGEGSEGQVEASLQEEEAAFVKVRKLVQMMRERLRPFPCRWLDCDAVLNSAHALTHHTALHTLHEEALSDSQPSVYSCHWIDPLCDRQFPSVKDLAEHTIASHTTVELYCAVTGCPQTFRDVDSHVAHMHGHLPHLTAQTNTLRPALLCKPLVPEGTLPSTPAIVPIFGDPPLIIYPTFIPPEKREQLARVVLARIDGRRFRPKGLHRHSDHNRPGSPREDSISRGTRAREFSDLNTAEVNKMFQDGAVWNGDGWKPAEDLVTQVSSMHIGDTAISRSQSSSSQPEDMAFVNVVDDDNDPLAPLGWAGNNYAD